MCNHIIYDICKRKLCSSLISKLEICGNDFADVCLLPLLQDWGWQHTAGLLHLRRDLGHAKFYSTWPKTAEGSLSPAKHPAWALVSASPPPLQCSFHFTEPDEWRKAFPHVQLEPTRINMNFCCHCCWEAQRASWVAIIPQDTSFFLMLSIF